MSYILEALKKAERERRKDSVPDLQAHHTPYPAPGRKYSYPQKPVTLLIGTLILFLIAASFLMYMRREPILEQKTTLPGVMTQENRPESRQQIQQETPQEIPVPQIESQPQQHVRQVQVKPQKVIVEPRPIIIEEKTVVTPPPPFSRQQELQLPSYDDLATTISDHLPRLSLAGHTYSDDPGQRMIIINNRIVREGQGLGNGLRLEEITWDGLILSFKGTRFTMDATQ
ncbi:general secretion pathway protein GspB [Desulfopila sp. IMCC35008]|uniref:general secretion pathway protein GspB n=1 Tax=Desulfopila sp. IMCC35008 TaxID=2653858 RepID=UPI0013D572FB|nr:general secretion pathway protein GspB [Desulfopila sp. IMCC35008]